jgi:hypothetical protein
MRSRGLRLAIRFGRDTKGTEADRDTMCTDQAVIRCFSIFSRKEMAKNLVLRANLANDNDTPHPSTIVDLVNGKF